MSVSAGAGARCLATVRGRAPRMIPICGICADLPSPTATVFSLDETAPGPTAPKCRDSGTVNYANGNPWQLIGTWSLPLP